MTIYSDSATLCIITIVVAARGDTNTVTLAHLDSPDCIKAFLEVVTTQGADGYQVIAQGANPADNKTSTGAKGMILESYGEGNFPSGNPDTPADGAIYEALNRANGNGINIVDCTQVIAGTVNSSAYAAGVCLDSQQQDFFYLVSGGELS